MKKWIWAVAVVLVVAVIGGYAIANHNNTQNIYANAMKSGKDAISDKRYTEAETDFENALKRKVNDPTAQSYLSQTQAFVSAEDHMDKQEFKRAQDNYTTVTNHTDASDVLITRAKAQLKILTVVLVHVDKYSSIYNDALAQNKEQNFSASNKTLSALFDDSAFTQPYYKKIYTKADALRKSNNDAIASNDSSSATSSSSTSKSSSLTKDEEKAAKNYQGTNEYSVTKKQTELNGKPITAGQIAAARSALKAAGIDDGAMSDQDVRSTLQQASAKGLSVGQYAKQYLK